MRTVIPGLAKARLKGVWGIAILVMIVAPASLGAAPVGSLTQFEDGTVAKAADVNNNFNVIKTAVDDNNTRIKALEDVGSEKRIKELEDKVKSLEEIVTMLQQNAVLALGSFVSVEMGIINDLSGPHVVFTGANIHIRSGSGATDDNTDDDDTLTGLGNLVVGYNEAPAGLMAGLGSVLEPTISLLDANTGTQALGGWWPDLGIPSAVRRRVSVVAPATRPAVSRRVSVAARTIWPAPTMPASAAASRTRPVERMAASAAASATRPVEGLLASAAGWTTSRVPENPIRPAPGL